MRLLIAYILVLAIDHEFRLFRVLRSEPRLLNDAEVRALLESSPRPSVHLPKHNHPIELFFPKRGWQ